MARTPGTKPIATNRSARRDFDVLETVEAGIVLKGSEVKSLRASHVQFADANVWIDGGEAWLLGVRIQGWDTAQGVFGHDPDRRKKLLLHHHEIERLGRPCRPGPPGADPAVALLQGRPGQGRGGARAGRRQADKRQVLAKRDAEREMERQVARSISGKGR